MLARVNDLTQGLNGAPQLVIGRVERRRGEADDVRSPEVRDDAAGLERPRDARSLLVLDGEVAAAPLRRPRGADGEAVGARREPALLQEPGQIVCLGQ